MKWWKRIFLIVALLAVVITIPGLLLTYAVGDPAMPHITNNKNAHSDTINSPKDSVIRIDIHLSAFGVESDDFPSIDGNINFRNDSNKFKKWFYDPKYKTSFYSLNKKQVDSICKIVQQTHWDTIKKNYEASKSDQATSTLILYTKTQKYTIIDYGLEAPYPLQTLYEMIYKL